MEWKTFYEKPFVGGKPLSGENLRAVVESLTWFGMEKLLFYEKPYVGGKPLLGENLLAVI